MTFLAVIALLPQLAFGEAVNGTWKGTYSYEDGRQPVSFELRLCIEGSRLMGSVSEPDSSGQGSLGAKLEGTVKDGVITFRKTYDGSGGFTHSVQYEGKVAGGELTGTWSIPPNASGPFEMKRDPASAAAAGCAKPPDMVIELR